MFAGAHVRDSESGFHYAVLPLVSGLSLHNYDRVSPSQRFHVMPCKEGHWGHVLDVVRWHSRGRLQLLCFQNCHQTLPRSVPGTAGRPSLKSPRILVWRSRSISSCSLRTSTSLSRPRICSCATASAPSSVGGPPSLLSLRPRVFDGLTMPSSSATSSMITNTL